MVANDPSLKCARVDTLAVTGDGSGNAPDPVQKNERWEHLQEAKAGCRIHANPRVAL